MRMFNKQIFTGNLDTIVHVDNLHSILDEAVSILGGLQQPPSCTEPPLSPEEHLRTLEDEARLRDICRDIVMGLTGKEINFV